MKTNWRRVFLIYGIGVLAAGQLGIVPPLVPALQRELGLPLATVGMIVSVVTLIGPLFGVFAGTWSQRLGHLRALRIGLLVMAAAAAACAACQDEVTLLVGRSLAGLGYLLVVVAAPSLLAATSEPRHQPFTLSLWSTFVPTGIAFCGVAAASLVDRTGWRIVFAIDAVVLASALAVLLVAVPDVGAVRTIEPAPRSPPPALPRAQAHGWLGPSAGLSISFFCFALLFLALAGLLPAYLVGHRGMAPEEAGRLIAVATACGIAGSLLAGWMMKHGMTPGRLVAAGLVVSTAAAAVGLAAAVPMPLAIAAFALSFAVGGVVPAATFASVPRLAADSRAIGPLNGLLAQAGSLGSLAGPPLLALWVGWAGWSLAPVLLLAIAGLGAAGALSASAAGGSRASSSRS